MLDMLFNICCDICSLCARCMGLSYGQFCILAFCYIQPLVMLLSGTINYKNMLGKLTMPCSFLYFLFYVWNYSVTTESFLVIYRDLHNWASCLGMSYVTINILLYIILPTAVVLINTIQVVGNLHKKFCISNK